jgi:hypothetical protein
MSAETISKNVALILSQTQYVVKPYQLPNVSAAASVPPWGEVRPKPAFVWIDAEKATLQIEQVAMLRALHLSCLSSFPNAVLNQLLTANQWKGLDPDMRTAQTIAHALVEIGAVNRLADVNIRPEDYPAWERHWHAVRLKLSFEPQWFSNTALDELSEIRKAARDNLPSAPDPSLNGLDYTIKEARGVLNILTAIEETITRVRYLRLRNDLQAGPDAAVEADRALLKARWQQLGFPTELETALEGVDDQIRDARGSLDFKQCMDLLRTVMERSTEFVALQAADNSGKPLPPAIGPRKFKEMNDQLVSLRLLSSHEGEVTQKLYNYLSTAGSHALSSAPEQVRVSRATVIEWTMMIAGRLQHSLASGS